MKRIVHLGLGNFHRAHQAWYTFKAGDWKITGVAITNAKLQKEMAASDNKFLLGTWGQAGLSTEVIDVIDEVLLASRQGALVASKIADETTHIVTLTITEKGLLFERWAARFRGHSGCARSARVRPYLGHWDPRQGAGNAFPDIW